MEQLTFFEENKIAFPKTHDDVLKLHKQFIDEGEKDEDAFEYKKIQDGQGRSYYFYGVKVMELTTTSTGKVRFCIKKEYLDENADEKEKKKFVAIDPNVDILYYMKLLKKAKREIFRNTITETFACCNDFERCSDAGKCLKEDNRMYNGCLYRKNLEAGRIFYGKNKTI